MLCTILLDTLLNRFSKKKTMTFLQYNLEWLIGRCLDRLDYMIFWPRKDKLTQRQLWYDKAISIQIFYWTQHVPILLQIMYMLYYIELVELVFLKPLYITWSSLTKHQPTHSTNLYTSNNFRNWANNCATLLTDNLPNIPFRRIIQFIEQALGQLVEWRFFDWHSIGWCLVKSTYSRMVMSSNDICSNDVWSIENLVDWFNIRMVNWKIIW